MASPGNGHMADFKDLTDSHEERIQRVEQTLQTVITSVAEFSVKQDYLSKQIEAIPEQIGDKLTATVERLEEKIAHSHEDAEEAKHTAFGLERRIEPLIEAASRRKATWQGLKKILIPLLIACGGVIASEVGKLIWGAIRGS